MTFKSTAQRGSSFSGRKAVPQPKPVIAAMRAPAAPHATPGLPSRGGKGNKRGH